MSNRLKESFFTRDTVQVARDLVGKRLVRLEGNQRISGIILETEAYRGEEDLAFLEQEAIDLPLLGYLPEESRVVDADRRGEAAYTLAPPLREAASRIADALTELMPIPGT